MSSKYIMNNFFNIYENDQKITLYYRTVVVTVGGGRVFLRTIQSQQDIMTKHNLHEH